MRPRRDGRAHSGSGAETDVLVIRRIDFLSAVLGNLESAATVEDTVAARLRAQPADVEHALST